MLLDLPIEVIWMISCHLRPEHLAKWKRVCRMVREIVTSGDFIRAYEQIWHLSHLNEYRLRALEGLKKTLYLESYYLVDKFIELCQRSESLIEVQGIDSQITVVESIRRLDPQFKKYLFDKIQQFNQVKSSRRRRLTYNEGGGILTVHKRSNCYNRWQLNEMLGEIHHEIERNRIEPKLRSQSLSGKFLVGKSLNWS